MPVAHLFKADNSDFCSLACAPAAGVIALDLAKELLELHPESYALVVSHENITNNYYGGKDKSMLICNVSAANAGCICCTAGNAALLLSGQLLCNLTCWCHTALSRMSTWQGM
jgi:hypothetical protein